MSHDEITQILQAINAGDNAMWDRLMRQTYQTLTQIAKTQQDLMHVDLDATLDQYGLVHEAYWSLYHSKQIVWQDRKHFYLTAAQAFRFLLANEYRKKRAQKRGRDAILFTTLQHALNLPDPIPEERIEYLYDGLSVLAKIHPSAHETAMLRFFSGLSEIEIAEILQVTQRTIGRYWRFARAYLLDYIQSMERKTPP